MLSRDWQTEYALTLRHTVKITRRSGFTTTPMGDRRPTGETLVTANASVYFDYFVDSLRYGGKYQRDEKGDFRKVEAKMYMLYNQDAQEGDLVYPSIGGPVGMTLGRMINVKSVNDFDGHTHHIECQIEKLG